jgi:hypothetical protein
MNSLTSAVSLQRAQLMRKKVNVLCALKLQPSTPDGHDSKLGISGVRAIGLPSSRWTAISTKASPVDHIQKAKEHRDPSDCRLRGRLQNSYPKRHLICASFL